MGQVENGNARKTLNEILRWNGKKWSSISTPQPDGTKTGAENILFGATCGSAGDCWAVGTFGGRSASTAVRNQALHWNGARWSLVKTPDPGGTGMGDNNELGSVRCVTPVNCWTVGEQQKHSQSEEHNEILHWNGTKWLVG